jgi:hypothetical protein
VSTKTALLWNGCVVWEDGYQRFGEFLFKTEDGDGILQKIGGYLQNYKALHPKDRYRFSVYCYITRRFKLDPEI